MVATSTSGACVRLFPSVLALARSFQDAQPPVQFARVLLQRPDWVFLDEATSALDETSQLALYRLLADELPTTTRVSVGHRASLRQLHDVEWTVERSVLGTMVLRELPAAERAI